MTWGRKAGLDLGFDVMTLVTVARRDGKVVNRSRETRRSNCSPFV